MADITANRYWVLGTAAQRALFTPDPVDISVIGPGEFLLPVWIESDTGDVYYWDAVTGPGWVAWPGGGGGGITELTGDVTAGPGSGSQAATIANDAVTTAKILNSNVTLGKLANSGALTVLGRSANSAGVVADITGANVGEVLQVTTGPVLSFAMPAMVKIEEVTPSSTGVVTFSSLGSFTHLEIRYSARGTQAATNTVINLQFNGDTGANYDRQLIQGLAANAIGAESLGQTVIVIGNVVSSTGSADSPGTGTIRVYDYRGTTFHKMVDSTNNWARTTATTNFFNQVFSGRWRSTAAITSITLTLASGDYVAGSKFSLYGIS